jgi:hypothetical protein
VSEIDVERLARAIAGDPDENGLACSETVGRRKTGGLTYEPCRREAFAYVTWGDASRTAGLCKLHTTLAIKQGAQQVRLITEEDDRAAEQARYLNALTRARAQAATIAERYACLAPDSEPG